MITNKRLHLKSGFRFKLRYSHNTLRLVSTIKDFPDRFHMFRVKDCGGTVYIGVITISYKYLHIEHTFEGLTFNDKYSFDDIEIVFKD